MQFTLNDAIPTAYLERLFLGTCYAKNFANASSPFGRHWDSRSCSCSICQSRTSDRDLGTVGHCKDHQLDIARIRHAENPQEPLSLGLYFGTKINVELWLQPWCRCKLQSMQRSSQHMSLVLSHVLLYYCIKRCILGGPVHETPSVSADLVVEEELKKWVSRAHDVGSWGVD